MNFLETNTKKTDQMIKYQEWADKNGLYSTIRLEFTNRGMREQYQKGKDGKIDWKLPKTMQNAGTELQLVFMCQAKSYTNVKDFRREFGIKKMGKDVASYDHTKMDFETMHEGVLVKLYAIEELGPRCKVVYEDVVVPASPEMVLKATPEHTKKVAKIVCN
tara:strand:+ start:44 stop:526 length:483 start_codon:yes stop_codon:yes gene_type:complete